jgi:hypothetical protein
MGSDQADDIYPAILMAYQLQWDRLGRLDSKINNTIVASTTAAGLFLGLGGLILPSIPKTNQFFIYLLLTVMGGVVLFTSSVILSIRAYKLRDYRYDPNPVSLWEDYGEAERSVVRSVLSSHLAVSTDHNKGVNDSKTIALGSAILALFGGVVAILLFGVLWLTFIIN